MSQISHRLARVKGHEDPPQHSICKVLAIYPEFSTIDFV